MSAAGSNVRNYYLLCLESESPEVEFGMAFDIPEVDY